MAELVHKNMISRAEEKPGIVRSLFSCGRNRISRPLNKDLAGSETVGLIPITEDIEA